MISLLVLRNVRTNHLLIPLRPIYILCACGSDTSNLALFVILLFGLLKQELDFTFYSCYHSCGVLELCRVACY
jgi:hypothetical protein